MNDKNIVGGVVVLLLVVGGVLFVLSGGSSEKVPEKSPAGALELAQCLQDSGAKFYGAFWCPHCEKQKELFGGAEKALPYVECSTPDGNSQTLICKQKGITGYPTWIFKDGSQLSGEQSFTALAEKSGCPFPGSKQASTTLETVSSTIVIPTEVKP